MFYELPSYLHHQRWAEVVFHPCLFVCLFTCEQDTSKRCGHIRTKLDGQIGCVTRKNLFNFGEDLNPDYLQNLQQSPLSSHLSAPYTKKDIDIALWGTKNGKATEADGIFPEFPKNLGEKSCTWLMALFAAVHKTAHSCTLEEG